MPNGPVEINSVAQWNQTLRGATASGQTVVVDCYATWCGPCKGVFTMLLPLHSRTGSRLNIPVYRAAAIAPVFDRLASELSHVVFVRVDVDRLAPIAQKYAVTAMPTFFAIKAGKVVETVRVACPSLSALHSATPLTLPSLPSRHSSKAPTRLA